MNNLPPSQEEINRLTNLAYYDILDSLPEQEYDNITQLAAHICQMPISLITFVDQDRQWFKSRYGITLDQTNRDVSFCAQAIRTPQQTMIVGDATKDERFAQNPLTLAAPNVIFYAGVPLVSQEGQALGTLCVIDTKSRNLSATQIQALNALANQVVALLDLRKKTRELEHAQAQEQQQLLDLQKIQQRLTTALAEERKLNELKSRFVSTVSHEFRTPLTTIQTSTDLIEHYLTPLKGEALAPIERHIGQIRNEISRFGDLLDGVLTLSQIDSGKLVFKPQPVDVVDLCHELLASYYSDRPDGRRVDVLLEGQPIWVELDAHLITQTLLNLLANAFKYSHKNPQLRIGFEAAHLVLQVTDRGIGIPEGDLPYVFNSFFRASNVSLLAGTGLGLSIASEYVVRHGGRLEVKSQINQGSTFTVVLPNQQAGLAG